PVKGGEPARRVFLENAEIIHAARDARAAHKENARFLRVLQRLVRAHVVAVQKSVEQVGNICADVGESSPAPLETEAVCLQKRQGTTLDQRRSLRERTDRNHRDKETQRTHREKHKRETTGDTENTGKRSGKPSGGISP